MIRARPVRRRILARRVPMTAVAVKAVIAASAATVSSVRFGAIMAAAPCWVRGVPPRGPSLAARILSVQRIAGRPAASTGATTSIADATRVPIVTTAPRAMDMASTPHAVRVHAVSLHAIRARAAMRVLQASTATAIAVRTRGPGQAPSAVLSRATPRADVSEHPAARPAVHSLAIDKIKESTLGVSGPHVAGLAEWSCLIGAGRFYLPAHSMC